MKHWLIGSFICVVTLLIAGAASAVENAPALRALVGSDGSVHISGAGGELATINAGLFEAGWKGAEASGDVNASDLNSTVRK
ncbi:MAG TPA: hypothetical protein VM223_15820, partial [Planctomycetota bacterium]|nr:hypothetical protein [Planctomycetota bacterium]